MEDGNGSGGGRLTDWQVDDEARQGEERERWRYRGSGSASSEKYVHVMKRVHCGYGGMSKVRTQVLDVATKRRSRGAKSCVWERDAGGWRRMDVDGREKTGQAGAEARTSSIGLRVPGRGNCGGPSPR